MDIPLIILLIILIIAVSVDCYYMRELSLAANKAAKRDIPLRPIFKPKPVEDTEEVKKYKTILANIDTYDGTGKGQERV